MTVLTVLTVMTLLEQQHNEQRRLVALFGHGQFLQAMRWLIRERIQVVDSTAMRSFRQLDVSAPVVNAAGFEAIFDGQAWGVRG